MADEKDRFGDKLYQAERGLEDQWARQRDAEILERLRRKYAKAIHCPQCGMNLDARVAIGVGGMACPDHHGAWGDQEALTQIAARLKNAAAIGGKSFSKKISNRPSELVEEVGQRHPREIDCPDCGTRLNAEAGMSPGAEGLAGMACPSGHGAWLDEDMLAEIRERLDAAAGARRK